MTAPEREHLTEHQCACILMVPVDGPDGTVIRTIENRCAGPAGPDQPMCDQCYESEHHLLPEQKPMSERRMG